MQQNKYSAASGLESGPSGDIAFDNDGRPQQDTGHRTPTDIDFAMSATAP
jgi:hypothetical protein